MCLNVVEVHRRVNFRWVDFNRYPIDAHSAHMDDAKMMREASTRNLPFSFNLNKNFKKEVENEHNQRPHFDHHHCFDEWSGDERHHIKFYSNVLGSLECKVCPFIEFLASRNSLASR